jgi:hypothetical protein
LARRHGGRISASRPQWQALSVSVRSFIDRGLKVSGGG